MRRVIVLYVESICVLVIADDDIFLSFVFQFHRYYFEYDSVSIKEELFNASSSQMKCEEKAMMNETS